jgi:hypothetical protein
VGRPEGTSGSGPWAHMGDALSRMTLKQTSSSSGTPDVTYEYDKDLSGGAYN